MNSMQFRPELIDAMKMLSANGYKCFILKDDKNSMYGHVITPSDNVIYIQRDSFVWNGWTFSLSYKANKTCGTGCQCLEDATPSITLETIQRAEREGVAFAHKLKAPLYKSSEEHKKSMWNPDGYNEVNASGEIV